MTTEPGSLQLAGLEETTDCRTFLARLLRLGDDAVVRLRERPAPPELPQLTVWAQPVGVIVSRQLRGRVEPADRSVRAAELLSALEAVPVPAAGEPAPTGPRPVLLPAARDQDWRGWLPPPQGWLMLDVVPVRVLAELAERSADAVRTAPDPVRAGEAMLDQPALRVSRLDEEVTLPLRAVTVLDRMGFLGPAGGPADIVRVTCTRTWTRVVARHGTIYVRRAPAELRLA